MRQYPRVSMNTSVLIKRGDKEIRIPSKDISIGGVGIEYTATLKEYKGETHIFFNLPETPFQIRAMVEIRWMHDGSENAARKGIGLKFFNLDVKSIERIQQYVKRNMDSGTESRVCPYCGMKYRWHSNRACYLCNNLIE